MKNGYYLSAYIHIDKLANQLKTAQRHDANIALWKKSDNDIELVHYWELERRTRIKKHRIAFYNVEEAKYYINKLLSVYQLTIDDMVQIIGTPELMTIESNHETFGNIPYHTKCHLASSMFMDTDIFKNENIIAIAVDGGPDCIYDYKESEKPFFSCCVSEKGKIKETFSISSPGILWEIAAMYYQMEEGSLMALASASKSKLLKSFHPEFFFQGKNDLENVIKFFKSLVLFVNSLNVNNTDDFNGFDSDFDEKSNKISMVMKEIQRISVEVMIKNIDFVIDKYGIEPTDAYISLSGGYILNCPSNTQIMQKFNFKGFISPPCVSDTGMSLGMGLYAFYNGMRDMNFKFANAFYGDMDERSVYEVLHNNFDEYVKEISEFKTDIAVQDIIRSPVVWFNGAAEVGPRALGNRSIIADPRYSTTKDKLNEIKKRQWWRPVSPIILDEYLSNWFDNAFESKYMLHAFQVKPDKQKYIPAVLHIDNSSRIQTLKHNDNPFLYNLIKAFNDNTGVPMICNTSLNDKGEPIINTIEQAIHFALKKQIDVAYINGYRVELHKHLKYDIDDYEIKWDEMVRNDEMPNIDVNIIQIYYGYPEFFTHPVNFFDESDCSLIKNEYKNLAKIINMGF